MAESGEAGGTGVSWQQDLHSLRRAVYRAAQDYYAARAKYFRARLASPPGAELLAHREECLVCGQLYRTTSELFILALGAALEEEADELPRHAHLLALLDAELKRIYAEARGLAQLGQ